MIFLQSTFWSQRSLKAKIEAIDRLSREPTTQNELNYTIETSFEDSLFGSGWSTVLMSNNHTYKPSSPVTSAVIHVPIKVVNYEFFIMIDFIDIVTNLFQKKVHWLWWTYNLCKGSHYAFYHSVLPISTCSCRKGNCLQKNHDCE